MYFNRGTAASSTPTSFMSQFVHTHFVHPQFVHSQFVQYPVRPIPTSSNIQFVHTHFVQPISSNPTSSTPISSYPTSSNPTSPIPTLSSLYKHNKFIFYICRGFLMFRLKGPHLILTKEDLNLFYLSRIKAMEFISHTTILQYQKRNRHP